MQIGNWKLTTDAIQLFFLVAMFSFGILACVLYFRVTKRQHSNLVDHRDRPVGDGGHGFELLGGLGKRVSHGGRIALIRVLHCDANDHARVEIDRMLGLLGQMSPAILHLRDLGVGIVRMGPVMIRPLLLALPIDARQVGLSGSSCP
jgi:hypothetical protein